MLRFLVLLCQVMSVPKRQVWLSLPCMSSDLLRKSVLYGGWATLVLAFRTARAISGLSPDDVRLAGLDGTGPSATAWNLTSAQPYVVSPNLTFVQRLLSQYSTVSGFKLAPIYTTHGGWIARSTAVVCFTCIAILSTYWGWWRLGRDVSMSPLEIARAFGA